MCQDFFTFHSKYFLDGKQAECENPMYARCQKLELEYINILEINKTTPRAKTVFNQFWHIQHYLHEMSSRSFILHVQASMSSY